ncbi:hypothetical protein SARC_05594 [Sphaeroforma arctica JP610]|uniref:Uncharacterized protein n=1 Tax=Sphaeroforma arctica JP610 TaxID=667725 RepID=A0A0L0FZ66_9EUKA|nr:hypothetical protein SARC_05594 [Sphaeroforma arctica JP610]KNC82105.1 hypothetical protein SARC_05594 [Sphaeroforma arctica JP610]|eukprot:XP_014156007.1 hypothetical protein SARC_05594 [Sphaeroforma arctica JP610]
MGIKKSRSPGRPMAPSITTTPAADETDLNQNSQHNQISGVDLVADSKSNTNTNINISTLRSASSTQLGRGREVVNTYQSLSTAVRVPFRSRSSLPNLVGASGSSAPSTAPAGTSIAEMTSGSSYGSVHNTTSTSRGGGGQDRRYYGHGESSSLLRGGYP